MTTKKWCIGFLCIIAASLLSIMGINYFVDPYGYFRSQGGDWMKTTICASRKPSTSSTFPIGTTPT